MKPYVCIGAIAATILAMHVQSTEDDCMVPLDVIFVQDTSYPYGGNLPETPQLSEMLWDIARTNPNCRFGVADVRDKPTDAWIGGPGNKGDYCYKLVAGLSDNVEGVASAHARLSWSQGYDSPDDVFQGIIDVLYDDRVGWRPMGFNSTDHDQAAARVIVVLTDSIPHIAGDLWVEQHKTDYPEVLSNPGPVERENYDRICNYYDYPSADQVKAALEQQNTYLVVLVATDDEAVNYVWRRMNRVILSQPFEFFLQGENANYQLTRAIQKVTDITCGRDFALPSPWFSSTAPVTIFPPHHCYAADRPLECYDLCRDHPDWGWCASTTTPATSTETVTHTGTIMTLTPTSTTAESTTPTTAESTTPTTAESTTSTTAESTTPTTAESTTTMGYPGDDEYCRQHSFYEEYCEDHCMRHRVNGTEWCDSMCVPPYGGYYRPASWCDSYCTDRPLEWCTTTSTEMATTTGTTTGSETTFITTASTETTNLEHTTKSSKPTTIA